MTNGMLTREVEGQGSSCGYGARDSVVLGPLKGGMNPVAYILAREGRTLVIEDFIANGLSLEQPHF